MNTKKSNPSFLSLGKELSRNDQKKILGGARVVCERGTVNSSSLWCSSAAAYCQGTGLGALISCQD